MPQVSWNRVTMSFDLSIGRSSSRRIPYSPTARSHLLSMPLEVGPAARYSEAEAPITGGTMSGSVMWPSNNIATPSLRPRSCSKKVGLGHVLWDTPRCADSARDCANLRERRVCHARSGKACPACDLERSVSPARKCPSGLNSLHTAEVTGSIPVAPTLRIPCKYRGFCVV